MRDEIKFLIFSIFIGLNANIYAQNIDLLVQDTLSHFPKEKLTIYQIDSKFTQESYQLYVKLPPDYQDSPQDRRLYPVVYHPDADFEIFRQYHFVDALQKLGKIQAIIVGIGYTKQFEYYWKGRAKDFLVRKEYNGAEMFLKFLAEEAVPLIENTYKVDTLKRTLTGYSYGGFFLTYALFHSKNLFHQYLSISPSLWWAEEIARKYEQKYAQENDSLPINLYISIGDKNQEIGQMASWKPFVDSLEIREYKAFTLKKQIFDGKNHEQVFTPAFLEGLLYLFPDSIPLKEVSLKNTINLEPLPLQSEVIFQPKIVQIQKIPADIIWKSKTLEQKIMGHWQDENTKNIMYFYSEGILLENNKTSLWKIEGKKQLLLENNEKQQLWEIVELSPILLKLKKDDEIWILQK